MKRSVLVALALFSLCSAFSQNKAYYSWAIGIRAGSQLATSGLTVKHFVGSSAALELIGGVVNKGFTGTLLFEQHVELFNRKEIQAYFGGGAHFIQKSGFGMYQAPNSRIAVFEDGKEAYGLDVVIGVSYKFLALPLAVSLDIKPFVEQNHFGINYFAIDKSVGLKFTF